MNRRDLLKAVAVVGGTSTIVPKALADQLANNETFPDRRDEIAVLKHIGWKPEQIAAWRRMVRFEEHVSGIYSSVANDSLQQVPNDGMWPHGDFRTIGRLAHVKRSDLGEFTGVPSPPRMHRLEDIGCFCIWRQTVRNKYTGEVKGFASWGRTQTQSVIAGQHITVKEEAHISMGDDEIRQFARDTLVNLQELVTEWHNRESV